MSVVILASVIVGVWSLMRAVDCLLAASIVPAGHPLDRRLGHLANLYTLGSGVLLSVPFIIIFQAVKP